MTYGFLPFAILPLYVSIDRMDQNLVQAGRDLYANGRGAFLHVTLPITMPGIVAAALLTFIPAMGDYVTPDLLGGAQTPTIAKIVQVLFTSGRDWPYGVGPRVPADGHHARRHADRAPVAAARDVRGMNAGPQPLADRVRGPDLTSSSSRRSSC